MTSNAYEPLLGGIYQTRWDARPLRVIGCNETEIHYDCWRPELKSWSFSGTRKSRVSFYRTSVQAFMEGAQLLEERPFSQSEWNCFRPDLPLQCTLRDGQGKVLFTQDFNQKTFSLHDGLWALPRGLYLVELQSRSSGQRELRKWLKME